MAPKTIPLTKGYTALVDEEDYDRVAAYKWCASELQKTPYKKIVYAVRRVSTNSTVTMHNFVMDYVGILDHRDNDGLNNQRENLRPATRSQNCANARKGPIGSSRFKGVSWHKARGKWTSSICKEGKNYFLGYFSEEVAAAKEYDIKAVELFGDFARLNF